MIVLARPGKILPGAPLEEFLNEFNLQGAEAEVFNIDKITEKIEGDIVFVYNAFYRLNKSRIDRLGIPVFNVPRVYGKHRQYRELERAGVAIPKYEIINKHSNLNKTINYLKLPIITKPIMGTGGRGVRLSMNERELRRSLGINKVVAQQYIRQASAGDVRAMVMGDEVVASLWRTPRRGGVASNFHAGGTPSPYKMTIEEKEMAVLAAKSMGLSVSGVDIVPTPKGPYVFEANSAPDLMYMTEIAGADLVAPYVRQILKALD